MMDPETLNTALAGAPLRIVGDRAKFRAHWEEGAAGNGEEGLGLGLGDPAGVAEDVAAQIAFLRKLKFQYLQQNAKDKYIKMIVSDIDDAPLITAAANEELHARNLAKKDALRAAKERLAGKQGDVRALAPLVEQDYHKARALTAEATTLSQQILDARLALSRLRSAHPPPRLTIPGALAALDAQVAQMQEADERVQDVGARVGKVKERVGERAREVERLRVRRTEVEKEVRERGGAVEVDDGVAGALYDWFTASLDLHRSLFSLASYHTPSENSLVLTYLVPPSPGRELVLTLVFVPNTRTLASAAVAGAGVDGVDVAEVVDAHVLTNDLPGLVAAVLARARGAA